MCQRNSVMITLFTAIVNVHGRRCWSHRVTRGRSNITAPIDHTPPSRKQSVGG